MARRVLDYDENNNNNESQNERRRSKRTFIERHLELGGQDDFLIIPNGGSGDCMFKTVSQAVYNGDESKHRVIRKKVVEFIIKERWEKFSEPIEVQHINGNTLLQRHWSKDPKQAYKMYMTLDGTLGASTELTAAGELFRYNFATIQEYCSTSQRTYRVENCILFDDPGVKFHYFYFTGDYDNGHWEYLRNLSNVKIEDGTYNGVHRTIIDGEEISMEDWLQRETENDNEADRLKIATNRAHFMRKDSPHPFESSLFRYNEDNSVSLNGERYKIAEDTESTDLFSVLAQECLQNEGAAHEAELILMKHRYSYFEDINYKLITQPYSHNFTIEAIKYCGHPCKGNIQDLISAADLYSFSFILFMKLDKSSPTVHKCKFTHVDRWGGESDRTLHFFMKLAESERNDEVVARWWKLYPEDENDNNGNDVGLPARADTPNKRSKHQLDREDHQGATARPKSADQDGIPRKSSLARTSVAGRSASRVSFQDVKTLPALQTPFLFTEQNVPSKNKPIQSYSEGIFEDGMETDECLRRDHEKIFGSQSSSSKVKPRKKDGRLVKKKLIPEKFKRATGKDLIEHPEKVKTLVKLSDRTGSGKAIMYTGCGILQTDDVLDQLKQKGLIKLPLSKKPSTMSVSKNDEERKSDLFMALEKKHKDYEKLRTLRDKNFNFESEKVENGKESESEVSFEHIVAEKRIKKSLSTTETQTKNVSNEITNQVSKSYLRYYDKNNLQAQMKVKKTKLV